MEGGPHNLRGYSDDLQRVRKLLYFYETNRAQWLKYNYGPKKALQVCEKTPKLSTCCAIVGLEEMHVKAQADEDLFTLLCS